MAEVSSYEVNSKGQPRSAVQVRTRGGTAIYLLPVQTFPGHINNIYLIDHPEHPTLFDCGTHLAIEELERRFEEIASRFGVTTRLSDVREAVVSHAHIDHFGGAREIRDRGIPISIHELDARVLEGFRERLFVATRDIAVFLRRAGMSADEVGGLIHIYQSEKDYFQDLEPDRRLRASDTIGPGWPLLHVPGHCPGMICLAVDDVVLTADHLLMRITPAQRPQSITPYMGLENYLRSLDKLRLWGRFEVGLGAHEQPILDIAGRIAETQTHHALRLRSVLDACRDEACNIRRITERMFPGIAGFSLLLGLSEVGAHVEYLHELRYLVIENQDAEFDDYLAPVRYRTNARRSDPLGLW